ncbi:MAG: crosslink repair DNA glycosylase YcaQ family protein, partial [Chloroflexota bacterium]
IHDWWMRNYGERWEGDGWAQNMRNWVEQNQGLRDFILKELTEKGALFSRQIESDGLEPKSWESSGWTNGRNVSRMLDFLWSQGKIMVTDRSGIQKQWDLTERCLPDWTPRDQWETEQVVTYATQKSLRALGTATSQQIKEHYTRARYRNLPAILKALEAEGRIVPVKIEGMSGAYYVHADDLALLDRIEAGEWSPRTTLLSPFDNLICDRKRTEALWDFYFRIEIYVPADKRQFGYYVLPILHDDRLIGRVDPSYDRKTKTLNIQHVYAEPDAPAEAAPQIRAAIDSLATFLGAEQIEYGEVPKIWKKKIR